MTRREFRELVGEALDALPERFAGLIENLAVVVEDRPSRAEEAEEEDLLMGEYIGVPRTERSVWDLQDQPDRIVLYQKNIEAYAAGVAEEEGRELRDVIREEIRLTVLHEVGHYFGMDEDELEDV